jgi:hypothetical protein
VLLLLASNSFQFMKIDARFRSVSMVGQSVRAWDRKRTSPMLVNRLAVLDRSTIAVEIAQNGHMKSLRGTAAYCRDPELGPVLRISVQEAWGDFEFILREDEFNGDICPGGSSGCDYRICLSAGSGVQAHCAN